jgi:hypothetical protein
VFAHQQVTLVVATLDQMTNLAAKVVQTCYPLLVLVVLATRNRVCVIERHHHLRMATWMAGKFHLVLPVLDMVMLMGLMVHLQMKHAWNVIVKCWTKLRPVQL